MGVRAAGLGFHSLFCATMAASLGVLIPKENWRSSPWFCLQKPCVTLVYIPLLSGSHVFIDPGEERLLKKEGALVLPHIILSSEGLWG